MSELDYSDVDSDLSEEEEEDQGTAGSRGRGSHENIYKQDELHEKLEDILWEDASFLDTQATTCSAEEEAVNVDDDLQRELCFYNQALAGARSAIQQLEEAGTPWLRPPDYYAEMVKSDAHMGKIKQKLMYEQKKIDESEERRKQREAKRANKEKQAERLKEKAQARKSNIAKVEQLRKKRKRSGFAGELDMDAELAAMDRPTPKSGGQRINPGRNQLSRKKEAKNSRFGFGGRKRLNKQNDSFSAADMNNYRPSGGKRGGKGGQQRPGKSKRAAARNAR